MLPLLNWLITLAVITYELWAEISRMRQVMEYTQIPFQLPLPYLEDTLQNIGLYLRSMIRNFYHLSIS